MNTKGVAATALKGHGRGGLVFCTLINCMHLINSCLMLLWRPGYKCTVLYNIQVQHTIMQLILQDSERDHSKKPVQMQGNNNLTSLNTPGLK